MSFLFTVAVNFNTHDGLQTHQPDGLQFATVLADTDHQATLIAAQMVSCHGVMPTRTTIIDVLDF